MKRALVLGAWPRVRRHESSTAGASD